MQGRCCLTRIDRYLDSCICHRSGRWVEHIFRGELYLALLVHDWRPVRRRLDLCEAGHRRRGDGQRDGDTGHLTARDIVSSLDTQSVPAGHVLTCDGGLHHLCEVSVVVLVDLAWFEVIALVLDLGQVEVQHLGHAAGVGQRGHARELLFSDHGLGRVLSAGFAS